MAACLTAETAIRVQMARWLTAGTAIRAQMAGWLTAGTAIRARMAARARGGCDLPSGRYRVKEVGGGALCETIRTCHAVAWNGGQMKGKLFSAFALAGGLALVFANTASGAGRAQGCVATRPHRGWAPASNNPGINYLNAEVEPQVA